MTLKPVRMIIAALLMLSGTVQAADLPPVVDSSTIEPEYLAESEPPTELSTELSGMDSLGVLPGEVVTRNAGGTRRVQLESTVFRRETPVNYEQRGLRDPFRALIKDEKREGEIETDLLRLEDAVLTGVVWSEGHYLAMVRNKEGQTFFLREGDRIYQGRVLMVTQSTAVFETSDFGEYQRTTLKVRG